MCKSYVVPAMISDQVLEDMAALLPKEERAKIFAQLCSRLREFGYKSVARLTEQISLATGIERTHVYPYLKRKRIPNSRTTAKVIKALIKTGDIQFVVRCLEPIARRMQRNCKAFFQWRSELKLLGILYSPLDEGI